MRVSKAARDLPYRMNEKYPELVQFYRDNKSNDRNKYQVQSAIQEHQEFAKVLWEIEYVLKFDQKVLDSRVREKMSPKMLKVMENPRLQVVINRAKMEIADSIYFHASSINQEVYHYSSKLYKERNPKKEDKKGKPLDLIKKAPGVGEVVRVFVDLKTLVSANSALFLILVLFLCYYLGDRDAWLSRLMPFSPPK
jgi:hypothetical protein